MVLSGTNYSDETMPQTVPSAGFTPPFDYSSFADSFDLSLLPGGDGVVGHGGGGNGGAPVEDFYAYQSATCQSTKPKIPTIFYQPESPSLGSEASTEHDTPDFQTLLDSKAPVSNNIYLEVPSSGQGVSGNGTYPSSPAGSSPYSPQSLLSPGDHFSTFPSPNSPHSGDISLYSPNVYPNYQYVKKEFYSSPNSPRPSNYPSYIKEENPNNYLLATCASNSSSSTSSSPSLIGSLSSNSDVLDLIGTAIIKQETTIDFDNILDSFNANESIRNLLMLDSNKQQLHSHQHLLHKDPQQDHQLLREVLRDTSFQKKYNIRPFDFDCLDVRQDLVKMEPDEEQQLPSDQIDPVLNLAFEQMKKDVSATCSVLGISPDPSQWSPANVLSWLQWTANQFGLPAPVPEQWDLSGTGLVALSEDDFARRASQSGSILHAQLEIWKATCNQEDFSATTKWGTVLPSESTSSNASSGGDMSDDEEEDERPPSTASGTDTGKPSTSRGTTGSSHIHLWQFLKELLASPQTHGSCIRWIDRSKGVFKIEDSVKVARLWGKRKNRPAMNYDKLSRSIRQYYKKGIMKKTERSQRLVYQFCHPYNL